MINKKLLKRIKKDYKLEWVGTHGIEHWTRVNSNGLLLAGETGANVIVVNLFAYLHDSCRLNEWTDSDHGRRAAIYAATLHDEGLFKLSADDLCSLCRAIELHADGLTEDNVTVQTCWDADRLDLGRVGIRPDPQYLCTKAAKKLVSSFGEGFSDAIDGAYLPQETKSDYERGYQSGLDAVINSLGGNHGRK